MSFARRNVELKARLPSRQRAQTIARQLAGEPFEVQQQVDTFFRCAYGRLKLREIAGQSAQLIWYDRPDLAAAKTSHYRLVEVADGEGLKSLLADASGMGIVVRKHREIYLWRNVRIHLDQVEGLGDFLEFEAVLPDDAPTCEGERDIAWLREQFCIADADLVSGAYADLLA